MKQHLLTILFLVLHTTLTYSQDFRAGFTGGLSVLQVDGDFYSGYNKAGYTLGGFVCRRIAPSIDLQFDISYISKGSRESPDPDNGKYDDYEIDLGYIQFPLVARYHFKQFSAEAGIAIAVLLGDDEFKDGQSIKEWEDVPPFQTMEYATIVGLNYHFTRHLWLNARFLYSLNRIRLPYDGEIPVYNPRPHWISRKPGQYNNTIVFSVYYAINRSLDY